MREKKTMMICEVAVNLGALLNRQQDLFLVMLSGTSKQDPI
jgi:hypothetical protein